MAFIQPHFFWQQHFQTKTQTKPHPNYKVETEGDNWLRTHLHNESEVLELPEVPELLMETVDSPLTLSLMAVVSEHLLLAVITWSSGVVSIVWSTRRSPFFVCPPSWLDSVFPLDTSNQSSLFVNGALSEQTCFTVNRFSSLNRLCVKGSANMATLVNRSVFLWTDRPFCEHSSWPYCEQ